MWYVLVPSAVLVPGDQSSKEDLCISEFKNEATLTADFCKNAAVCFLHLFDGSAAGRIVATCYGVSCLQTDGARSACMYRSSVSAHA